MTDVKEIEECIKGNFCYFPSQIPSMNVDKSFGFCAIDSHVRSDMFNIVYPTGKETKESIDPVIAHFQKVGRPFCFWTGFSDEGKWLKEELVQRGLSSYEEDTVMSASFKDIKWRGENPDFEALSFTDTRGLHHYLSVFGKFFPSDEMEEIENFYYRALPLFSLEGCKKRFMVGYYKDEPIATISLFYEGGMATIFDLIVAPKMQGAGFGRMMTLSAIRAAREEGFERFALSATNDAKHLYERLGFKALKTLSVYQ